MGEAGSVTRLTAPAGAPAHSPQAGADPGAGSPGDTMKRTALAPLLALALPTARRRPSLARPGREARLLGGGVNAEVVYVRPR